MEKEIDQKEIDGKRFAYLCYQVFGSGLGKELLTYLDKIYQEPVADPFKSEAHAYFREGQNDLIRRFKAAINLHTLVMRKEYEPRSDNTPSD